VYLHRLRAAVASMAAAMGGLDVLVFTGGVGENAPAIRARAAPGLGFLGVAVDPALNVAADPPGAAADPAGRTDRQISPTGTQVSTWVIRAREDIQIVREVRQVLG